MKWKNTQYNDTATRNFWKVWKEKYKLWEKWGKRGCKWFHKVLVKPLNNITTKSERTDYLDAGMHPAREKETDPNNTKGASEFLVSFPGPVQLTWDSSNTEKPPSCRRNRERNYAASVWWQNIAVSLCVYLGRASERTMFFSLHHTHTPTTVARVSQRFFWPI